MKREVRGNTTSTLRENALRLVAVDPGDAWCGVAALELRGPIWSAYTMVIHATPRTMPEVIVEIMRCNPHAVIAEKYQQRAVGHQKWAEPRAPRILGALEYVAYDNGLGFHTIQPDSPEKLMLMPFWPIIKKWRKHWQRGNAPDWQHALSAWRVLGAFMMQPVLLPRLVTLKSQEKHVLDTMSYQPVEWLGDMSTVADRDLTSTPVQWSINA